MNLKKIRQNYKKSGEMIGSSILLDTNIVLYLLAAALYLKIPIISVDEQFSKVEKADLILYQNK